MPNDIKAIESRKLIITDGIGFIGANLAKGLVANNSVIIIHNLSVDKGGKLIDQLELDNNVDFVGFQQDVAY